MQSNYELTAVSGCRFTLAAAGRHEDVEYDGPCESRYAVAEYKKHGGKQKHVATEILAKTEVLEFKRKHSYTAYHQKGHNYDYDGYNRVVVALGALQPARRSPHN